MGQRAPSVRTAIAGIGLALLAAACSGVAQESVVDRPTETEPPTSAVEPANTAGSTVEPADPAESTVEPVDPGAVYDPVLAGEPLPEGYRQLLDRDQIAPIYNPEFTTPDQVDWPEDSLVIGLAGAETAKAYPVTHLNQREMVIDSLEGIPVLVTW